MIGEIGEVIDIVKKNGPKASEPDNPERKHLERIYVTGHACSITSTRMMSQIPK